LGLAAVADGREGDWPASGGRRFRRSEVGFADGFNQNLITSSPAKFCKFWASLAPLLVARSFPAFFRAKEILAWTANVQPPLSY
jgi:hypothetical protein